MKNVLLVIMFFSFLISRSQKITDVHKEELYGHVESIKTKEYYTKYNKKTKSTDTILLPNELLHKDKFFDINGNLIKEIDYHYREKIVNVYSIKNQLIEKTKLDIDGKDLIKEKAIFKYNLNGNILEEIVTNKNGILLRKYVNKYDSNGFLLENIKYNEDKKPVRRYTYKHNKTGKLILKIDQDKYWQSYIGFNHKYEAEYDIKNNLKKETHFCSSESGGVKEYERYYHRTGLDSVLIWYYKSGKIKGIDNNDEKGNLVKYVSYKENGILDEKTEYKNTYNNNGKLANIIITCTDKSKNGESNYKYDNKNRLVFSDEKTSFYGANAISRIKYDKWGNVIESNFTDYAERLSSSNTKYDSHNNRIYFYESNAGPDVENGHDNYNMYKYEIKYYEFKVTDIISVEKARIYNLKLEESGMYVLKGDSIYTYYKGQEYSSFDYKTKSGIYISGFIKNTEIMKIK